MNKLFSQEKIDQVKKEIDRVLNQNQSHPIAAFDADGTLWPTDMGEGMFKYQIEKTLIPDLPENPWDYYLRMHKQQSPPEAFLWLAQINAGLPLEQIKQWAKESIEHHGPLELFDAQKEIISHLQQNDVDVFVVTASVKWAVEPAAELYNIPEENVIGVATQVVEGLITDEQEGHVTWREGKVEGLLTKTEGKKPFFASGNTTGDLPLLESSSDIRLVIASAEEGHINHEKERHMLDLAKQRSWFFHSYI